LPWLPFWASQHNHILQDEVVSLKPNPQPWMSGSEFVVCCPREVGKILRSPSYALGHSSSGSSAETCPGWMTLPIDMLLKA
jgi:hypothetical protein